MKKKKEEQSLTIACPLRGHNHNLTLVPRPDRPDLLIAKCGEREVYQVARRDKSQVNQSSISRYSVPDFKSEGE